MPIAGNTSFQAPAYPHPNGPNRSEAPPESRMDLRSGSGVKPTFQPVPGTETAYDFARGFSTCPSFGGGAWGGSTCTDTAFALGGSAGAVIAELAVGADAGAGAGDDGARATPRTHQAMAPPGVTSMSTTPLRIS